MGFLDGLPVYGEQPAASSAPAAGAPFLSTLPGYGDTAPRAAANDSLLPASPYGATDAALHGMTFGLSDAANAALDAGSRYLRGQTPNFDYAQAAREIQRGREAYEGQSPFASAAANLTGAFASGAPNLVARAVTPLGKIAVGALTGAGIGGVQGAADNNASVGDALSGAQSGAQTGALVGGGIPAAATAARTLMPGLTPAAQALRAAGVEPPPGAAAGGLPAVAEELLGKIPIIGAPVQTGRQAAAHQLGAALADQNQNFNRDTINRGLGYVGEALDPNTQIGHPAVAEMARKIGAAYDAAIPTAGGPITPQLTQDISSIQANAKLGMGADHARRLDDMVQKYVLDRASNGALTGQAFKDADSDLGREAAGMFSGNSSPDDRKLGRAIQSVQGELRNWLVQVSPANAADIQAANKGWAELLRIQNAAGRAGTNGGEFTPEQLMAASRKYANPAQFARGGALMQDVAGDALLQRGSLTSAGRQVLPSVGPINPAGAHGTGIGTSLLGADIIERALEHVGSGNIPAMAALGSVYPALMGAYSNTGRGLLNSAMARAPGLLNPIGSLSPLAVQQDVGRRNGLLPQ
jgi:hypothetical protein